MTHNRPSEPPRPSPYVPLAAYQPTVAKCSRCRQEVGTGRIHVESTTYDPASSRVDPHPPWDITADFPKSSIADGIFWALCTDCTEAARRWAYGFANGGPFGLREDLVEWLGDWFGAPAAAYDELAGALLTRLGHVAETEQHQAPMNLDGNTHPGQRSECQVPGCAS